MEEGEAFMLQHHGSLLKRTATTTTTTSSSFHYTPPLHYIHCPLFVLCSAAFFEVLVDERGGEPLCYCAFADMYVLFMCCAVVFEVMDDEEGDAFMLQHHGSLPERTARHGVGRLYVRTHIFR
jgi:hypothetical protein